MKLRTFALTALLLTAPALSFAATEKPAAHAEAGIDWYKGDVDAAFSYAKNTTNRYSCIGAQYGAHLAIR